MKQVFYSTTIILLFLAIISLGYFVTVNTIFKDIPFTGSQDSSANVAGAQDLREMLDVTVEGQSYKVAIADLQLELDDSKVKAFGKGADLSKVLQDGVTLLINDSNEIEYQLYKLNKDALFAPLSFRLSDQYGAYTENTIIKNCNSEKIKIDFNETQIAQKILQAKQTAQPFTLSYEEIGVTEDQQNIINHCNQLFDVQSQLRTEFNNPTINAEDFLQVDIAGTYSIKDEKRLVALLTNLRFKTYQEPKDGEYVETNSEILIISPYTIGKDLDVNQTVAVIKSWLQNTTNPLTFVYKETLPPVTSLQKPLRDFSKVIAQGSTRMQQYVDGYSNVGIYFAELGLDEIDNIIVQPNEEFSFLKKIAKQPGLNITANGRLIGGGYCNSTTTLFRATLEAGFPITDRSYHWFNVPSYDWGYELNIVDAAFYTEPGQEVDFKFINDLDYPILLHVKKETNDDGYQYHTVEIHAAADAVPRKVELYDFQKTADYGANKFDALFRRKVTEGNVVVREDEFRSLYR